MKELPPAADLDAALATAEGRVLEEVIRTEEGSMLLAKLLGLQVSMALLQHIWHLRQYKPLSVHAAGASVLCKVGSYDINLLGFPHLSARYSHSTLNHSWCAM